MILEGMFLVPAPRERVWEAIWHVPTMVRWVPGCTSAEDLGDGRYRAHLEQQVGILKASFDLDITVAESAPPERIRISARGRDRRLMSEVQLDSAINLESEGEGTVFRYRHDMKLFGRLGSLGFVVFQRRARELEAEFVRRATESLTEA